MDRFFVRRQTKNEQTAEEVHCRPNEIEANAKKVENIEEWDTIEA